MPIQVLVCPQGDSPIHHTASATHIVGGAGRAHSAAGGRAGLGRLTFPPARMLPRAQRTKQTLALTITWLATSLTSRSWHGSPSPGFPVLQMLLCCKERPRSAVGGGQGPAPRFSRKKQCKAALANLAPFLHPLVLSPQPRLRVLGPQERPRRGQEQDTAHHVSFRPCNSPTYQGECDSSADTFAWMIPSRISACWRKEATSRASCRDSWCSFRVPCSRSHLSR